MEERKKDYKEQKKILDKLLNEKWEKLLEQIEEREKRKMQQTQELKGFLDNTEAVLEGEVKAWGTSAHIPLFKRYAGRKVKIIILKDKQEDSQDKKDTELPTN